MNAAAERAGIKPKGTIAYPPGHKPGMRVPEGGSSCLTCKFHRPEGNRCASRYFRQWHGSDKIPAPANEYCSDWYEEK